MESPEKSVKSFSVGRRALAHLPPILAITLGAAWIAGLPQSDDPTYWETLQKAQPLGALLAGGTLAAIWFLCGPGHFGWRCFAPAVWLPALAWAYYGGQRSYGYEIVKTCPADFTALAVLSSFVALLLIGGPVWWTGFRLDLRPQSRQRQFGLRSLFALVFFAGAMLACGRWCAVTLTGDFGTTTTRNLYVTYIVSAVIVTPPLFFAAAKSLQLAALLAVPALGAVFLAEYWVTRNNGIPGVTFATLCVMSATHAAWGLIFACLVRGCGLKLQSPATTE